MEYVITTVVVAVFILFILIWAKKTNQRQAERIKMLSQEQLDFIKCSDCVQYQNKKNLIKISAVLTHIKECDSSNVPVDFIYWNYCTQRYELGDSKISRNIINDRRLKIGDYIHVVFKLKNGYINSLEKVI